VLREDISCTEGGTSYECSTDNQSWTASRR